MFFSAQSHCASNPCQNDAVCIEKENDFQCSCPEGYIGKRCARKSCIVVVFLLEVVGVLRQLSKN